MFICARSAADVEATVKELTEKGHNVYVSDGCFVLERDCCCCCG